MDSQRTAGNGSTFVTYEKEFTTNCNLSPRPRAHTNVLMFWEISGKAIAQPSKCFPVFLRTPRQQKKKCQKSSNPLMQRGGMNSANAAKASFLARNLHGLVEISPQPNAKFTLNCVNYQQLGANFVITGLKFSTGVS